MNERESLRKKVLDFLEVHGIEFELFEHPALSCI